VEYAAQVKLPTAAAKMERLTSSKVQVRSSDLMTRPVVSRSSAILGIEGTKEPDTNTAKILNVKTYHEQRDKGSRGSRPFHETTATNICF